MSPQADLEAALSPEEEAQLNAFQAKQREFEARVLRLEHLLDRAIAKARLTAAGRAILAMLGLT